MARHTKPIVVIGGGFAGLRAALDLDKVYGGQLDAPIFLIDPSPYHIYTPSLYEVAGANTPRIAALSFDDILLGTHIKHIQERVVSIDLEHKCVMTEHGQYRYEDLVLAVGSQNKTQSSHQKVTSFTYKTLEDVLHIRNHIAHCFRRKTPPSPKHCDNHFIVVGGGPAGVEFVAGLRHYIATEAHVYGASDKKVKITLLEAGERILGAFDATIAKKTAQFLKSKGVEIVTKTMMHPEGRGYMLDDEMLPFQTIFWTIGVQTHALVAKTKGLRHDERGRVLVDASLQVLDHPGVWVVGDNASVKDTGLAWSAQAHGQHVARSIQAVRHGRLAPAYHPQTFPVIIPLSPTYGVGRLPSGKLIEGLSVIWYKRWLDLRYYLSILPIPHALAAWLRRGMIIEEEQGHAYRAHAFRSD